MREINVRFTIDNAAFDDRYREEIRRRLGAIAGALAIGINSGKVVDANENAVGEWSITETDGDK